MLEAVRALDAEHLEPLTMALREPTLDDVFLSLTGHGAEDGGDGDDDTGDGARARRSRRRSQ
jgi:ABC-2 type transport system ATP-binding protein